MCCDQQVHIPDGSAEPFDCRANSRVVMADLIRPIQNGQSFQECLHQLGEFPASCFFRSKAQLRGGHYAAIVTQMNGTALVNLAPATSVERCRRAR